MSVRRLAERLLGVAAFTTLTVTGMGVLIAPAAPGPALSSAEQREQPAEVDSPAEVPVDVTVRAPSVPLPEVKLQRQTDFTIGDGLPDGGRVFNTGANRSGMALTGGLLVHGEPESSGAVGFVETKLKGEVRLLGLRVRFPDASSGSVALVGWQTSLVDADRKGAGTPATGMRLVASPGRWELTVVDGEVIVIGSGTYAATDGPATFEVRRSGSRLYVVDPTGAVTVVEDKRAARLAGPWASWGLSETGPEQVPASIEAVWAG
ncbi:hypothetical protein [Nocardioides dilutus]